MPKRDNGSTTLFRALSNYRRQAVIQQVGMRERKLSDLAEEIGRKEAEMDDETYDSAFRKRAYVSLHQSHLPKLDEWGFVEYNKDRQTIKVTWKGRLSRWIIRLGKLVQ